VAGLDVDSLKQQIPYYLTAEDQRVLLDELRALSEGANRGYILNPSSESFADEMLQGDGWTGFQLFLFESGERRPVRGLVLSNSCDIDPDNQRDTPSRVLFAPLARLSVYEKLLTNGGVAADKIKVKLDAIRRQKVTNLFYIPAGQNEPEEYIVRFDEAQSMPLSFHFSDGRKKLFTLSNTGFYMLILKISVHFCRLQEKVQRGFS